MVFRVDFSWEVHCNSDFSLVFMVVFVRKYAINQISFLFVFVLLLLAFFNTSLLQIYIHTWGTGGHVALVQSTFHKWYSQHFISHKHGMNEHTGKREVDESISLQKKRFVRLPLGRESLT